MDVLLIGILIGVALWWVGFWIFREFVTPVKPLADQTATRPTPPAEPSEPPQQDNKSTRFLELATECVPFFEAAGKPSDLLENPAFQNCVHYLNTAGFSNEELLGYFTGGRVDLACLALEALSRRDCGRDVLNPVLHSISSIAYWVRYFALRCLDKNLPPPQNALIGEVLVTVDESWTHPASWPFLQQFVAARVAAGERASFGSHIEGIDEEKASFLLNLLPRLDEGTSTRLTQELQGWLERRIDVGLLNTIGQVWDADQAAKYKGIIEHTHVRECIARAEEALLESPRRSVLLVGESGVGKSAIIGLLGRRLVEKGWTVFEAGHTEMIAGKIYIGEFEERLQTLVRQIGGHRRVLWIIPDFAGLATTGKHRYSTSSALDYLLPYIESGEVTVAGEVAPTAYERMLQENPRCQTALDVFRVHPLPDDETLDLARIWASQFHHEDGTELIPGEVLEEAWNLTTQYLWAKAKPGNLLQFLALTVQRLVAGDLPQGRQMTVDDLLITLGKLTGLPRMILDDREALDLEGLRDQFHQRVMGQQEAVDCLVERVAMIKAGVTDPTRPQGVFLFAGPTGTGKTEIGKTLAEFLFGSRDRMIRLDMSEFQEPASINRLLGDPEEPKGDALVDLIRKDPFAVVLLDEFEKAVEPIWNMFLQVFDDGRLTDRLGRVADFRHAIIILTSNLGGALRDGGTSLGFTRGSSTFSGRAVEMAITKTFNKEFINRLDRIVIFRPLSRDVMREILTMELEAVFKRRGLRSRAWAVEWDASALDFLLEKGFTVDLGARPLKRAVERHFLAPLAATIVKHQFPEGDQFLFVRRDESALKVEFIDPDAPEPELERAGVVHDALPADRRTADVLSAEFRVEDLILHCHGNRDELDFLDIEFTRLGKLIHSNEFKETKQAALAATASPGFWNSPDRFKVLGRAEFLDRIESTFRTAASLMERLDSPSYRDRERVPRDLLVRLAQTIYLLNRACEDVVDDVPNEAFLLVEAGQGGEEAGKAANEFARRLGQMYKAWAEKREMRLEILEESRSHRKPYRLLLSVSGYAAYSTLARESGLHFFEIPKDEGRQFTRSAARVRVSPQPDEPIDGTRDEILARAMEAIEAANPEPPEVVRRYREKPSPLVRDSVRGWRTGLLDRVMAGDFDLIAGKE